MTRNRTPYTNAIAGVIKAERNRIGLTQDEFGTRAGLSGITIKRFESALRSPDTEQLEAMSRVIGRTPSWMLQQAEEQVARLGE